MTHSTLAPLLNDHFAIAFEPAVCERYEKPFCSPYWVLRDTRHGGSVIGHTHDDKFISRVIDFLGAQPGALSEEELRERVHVLMADLRHSLGEHEWHAAPPT